MTDPDAALAERLERLAAALVDDGGCTAAVVRVDSSDGVLGEASAGVRRREGAEPVSPRDRFDLASLTKPFVGELARRLDRSGKLSLGAAVGEIWPRASSRLASRPLALLLEHRAGLAPWTPLYARCAQPSEAEELLVSEELLTAPPGTYSDLDFILWGRSVERALGVPLARLVAEELEPAVGEPLGPGRKIVECRLDNRREIELAAAQGFSVTARAAPPAGQPQDGNARFLGGVAGHAGLFASAAAVAWLGRRALAAEGVAGRPMGERRPPETERGYSIGWARPVTWRGGGGELDRACFGHLGFTGTSVWVDPLRDRIAVLLAHRSSTEVDLDPWRRRFHRLAFGRDLAASPW